ncbi:TPA: Sec-independent protein translocase protein TatB, partial [Campylobacter jejuni]
MSFGEIIVILVVAILVLGPDKLPEAIVQIAKILKAVKRNIDDAKSSIEKEIRINDLKEEAKKYKDEFS